MITGSVTLEDYVSAHRLHHGNRYGFYWISSLAIIIGAFLFFTNLKWAAKIILFGGIGGVLGHLWDQRIGFPDRVEHLYKQHKGIEAPISISWNSELIEGKSEQGSGNRKWSDFVGFKENDLVMILYITDQLWQVYPKHWFSADQLAEFRSLATGARKRS